MINIDTIFLEIVKVSSILGLMIIFWHYSRQDYKNFVDKVQAENACRERRYQDTITTLSNNLNIIKYVKNDIEEIKYKLK
ncbi:BhlA/UviB family holin-like peptide [Clostridium sp.]|jgi:hypothetical protein|uniref:BhlA/UviB family holin-like peptide n=1 Tax=Clostridium sp. TaxID=1506 RepID=UPI002FDD6926